MNLQATISQYLAQKQKNQNKLISIYPGFYYLH